MIKIQKENFNLDYEIDIIKSQYSNIGAVSIFTGYVRDINNDKKVESIKLEVYQEMAHKTLGTICKTAKKKWDLIDFLIIHRYGDLKAKDKIVLVATFSMHRKNSMEACTYIMNYLKKDAPFWKKEFYEKNSAWL